MSEHFLPPEDWESWYRHGGHRLDFYGTPEDVQSCLEDTLGATISEYLLIQQRVEGERPDGPRELHTHPVADLAITSRRTSSRPVGTYLYRPDISGPIPDIEPKWQYDGYLMLSGLVWLNLDADTLVVRHESSIAQNRRVVNSITGEVKTFESYYRVFSALKRRISKHLVYLTNWTDRSGSTHEDTRTRWTEAAVAAYESGQKFSARPGRRV
jgi:hypothetical protein